MRYTVIMMCMMVSVWGSDASSHTTELRHEAEASYTRELDFAKFTAMFNPEKTMTIGFELQAMRLPEHGSYATAALFAKIPVVKKPGFQMAIMPFVGPAARLDKGFELRGASFGTGIHAHTGNWKMYSSITRLQLGKGGTSITIGELSIDVNRQVGKFRWLRAGVEGDFLCNGSCVIGAGPNAQVVKNWERTRLSAGYAYLKTLKQPGHKLEAGPEKEEPAKHHFGEHKVFVGISW